MSDDIEWGEWRDGFEPVTSVGDVQLQYVGGKWKHRFPKPKIEAVTLHWRPGQAAGEARDARDTHTITLICIDGVWQPTAAVEEIK